MRLYEMADAYNAMIEEYDTAETDEERETILEALLGYEDDIAVKAENYARIIRNEEAEAKAFDDEIKRLTAHKAAREAAVKRLKENLLAAMQSMGTGSIDTSIGTWRVQRNPWSCDVTDASKVPERFLVPQPPKVDRRAALEAFKREGEYFPGLEFKQGASVRFR